MGEWISVKDWLPEYGVEVLATFKGQFGWVMFVAEKCFGELKAPGYAAPDFWQPLPAPPEANHE